MTKEQMMIEIAQETVTMVATDSNIATDLFNNLGDAFGDEIDPEVFLVAHAEVMQLLKTTVMKKLGVKFYW